MSQLTPHQSKAINIERSISLTANAGSGKTFVLAQRYLEIILNTNTPLSKVAAITFTERAAGELYKRIADELDKSLFSATEEKVKEKIEKVRKQLVSAKISTIHSFCIDLLKEFPVEVPPGGIDANFVPISEQRTDEIMDLCIENVLKEMLIKPEKQSDIKILIRLLGSKPNLKKELALLLLKRKNILLKQDYILSKSEKELAEELFRIFNEQLKIIFEKELPLPIHGLENLNNTVLHYDKKNEIAISAKTILSELNTAGNDIYKLGLIKKLRDLVFTKDLHIRKKSYLDTSLSNDLDNTIETVETFFNDLDEIELKENHNLIELELAKYTKIFIRVFQKVYSEFEKKKYELGVLDFEDILLKTKSLLNVKSVQKLLFKKFEYVLVDEYQDTNEIQYEIFLPLVDYLKSGNLFIVGDEKQSIYRFRDADLKVFSETKTDIRKINGDESLLTLPDSFRLAPAVCLFVNSLFRELFSQPKSIYNEVESSELICARQDNFEGKVEILLSSSEEENEAELLVRRIINLKNDYKERLPEWNKITVLVRKRSSFSELQKALIKYKVPFNVVGGTGFYQQQNISDVYNYISFLFNDKDDAALIGILRSPFFITSDEEIFSLFLFKGESFWEKLKTASGKNNHWQKKYEMINENKHLINKIPVPSLLRKILSETNFISTIASRPDVEQRISNLNKLLSLTIEFFNEGFNTLYDYISFLKNSISGTEDESQASINVGNNGINLMTIHQAKGLEFPAVFLYKCDDISQLNKVKARSLIFDKTFGLLTKVPINEDYFGNFQLAPIGGIYNFLEIKKEIAEIKRLLYVALTRAKDFLFISQSFQGDEFKKNSFSGMLKDGLRIDFNKDAMLLEGELTILNQGNGSFTNKKQSMKIEIPITRNVQIEEEQVEEKNSELTKKEFLLNEVNDQFKGEVLSATRFAVFSNCPLKYNLLYNYKMGDLISFSNNFESSQVFIEQLEYNRNELSSFLFDDKHNKSESKRLKGKIIHRILQKNIQKDYIGNFIADELNQINDENIRTSISEQVINEIINFYNSAEYKFLNSFKSYKNEFEVYVKVKDYYLFGIIDKLIFNEDKMILVDYKTDTIAKEQILITGTKYLPQLKFYSYIIKRLFNYKSEIEGRVVFIKQPEDPFIFSYADNSDEEMESNISLMINSIRSNNYSLNLNHCKECLFADENLTCIKTKVEKDQNKIIHFRNKV